VVLVIALAAPPGTSGEASSRILDRTFVCTLLGLYEGVGHVEVIASPRGALSALPASSFDASAGYIGVSSGRLTLTSELVFARARNEPRTANLPFPRGVYASTLRCIPSRARVALSRGGLPGPPIRWAEETDCFVRGSVLLRVRALLRTQSPWRPYDPPFVGARETVLSAKIGVRSPASGKRIAYLELDSAGRTKVWHASGCE
jgi:hypothetical protein